MNHLKMYSIFLCGAMFLGNARARTIDPQTRTFLDAYCAQDIHLAEIPLVEFRADETLFAPEQPMPVFNAQDISIEGDYGPFALRIYQPKQSDNPLPMLLFFHGGGWVWGSLNSHDGFCRELCMRASVIVISVDYHRAPEYKFPAAISDCYTAVCWVAQNGKQFGGDTSRIGVIGDSAGGNLAVAVCLMARDQQFPPLQYQILMYPVLDYNFERPSYQENGAGYFLTTPNMRWFWHQYLADIESDQSNQYAVPLRAENTHNLPPAFLLLAEFDPLRDEGLAYYKRLQEVGNDAQCKIYNTIHCFIGFGRYLAIGRVAIDDIIAYIALKNKNLQKADG